MVTLVSEMTPHKLSVSSAILTVLGTVLGLVISFRTSSAYERSVPHLSRLSLALTRWIVAPASDRYMDGRRLWTTIAIASRNLALLVSYAAERAPTGEGAYRECAIDLGTRSV